MIERNPSIITGEISKYIANYNYETSLQTGQWKNLIGRTTPHNSLQAKGLIFSSPKGRKAKYWELSDLGKRVLNEPSCISKESDDLADVMSTDHDVPVDPIKGDLIVLRNILRSVIGADRWFDEVEPQLSKEGNRHLFHAQVEDVDMLGELDISL